MQRLPVRWQVADDQVAARNVGARSVCNLEAAHDGTTTALFVNDAEAQQIRTGRHVQGGVVHERLRAATGGPRKRPARARFGEYPALFVGEHVTDAELTGRLARLSDLRGDADLIRARCRVALSKGGHA
jgi:hypothetical protein